MKNFRTLPIALFAFLVCSLINVSSGRAGVPMDQLRSTTDKVLDILKDPNLKSEGKKEERRAELRKVIYQRFDFDEMAKRSLGPNWARRSPEEQREFVKLFTDLLENTYADKMESYNGEKILYGREKQEGDDAQVDTKIVTQKGEQYSINYKLHPVGGDWKVYDVVIENISLVNNYRSQFNHVLASSSFDDLLRRMRQNKFAAPETKKS